MSHATLCLFASLLQAGQQSSNTFSLLADPPPSIHRLTKDQAQDPSGNWLAWLKQYQLQWHGPAALVPHSFFRVTVQSAVQGSEDGKHSPLVFYTAPMRVESTEPYTAVIIKDDCWEQLRFRVGVLAEGGAINWLQPCDQPDQLFFLPNDCELYAEVRLDHSHAPFGVREPLLGNRKFMLVAGASSFEQMYMLTTPVRLPSYPQVL